MASNIVSGSDFDLSEAAQSAIHLISGTRWQKESITPEQAEKVEETLKHLPKEVKQLLLEYAKTGQKDELKLEDDIGILKPLAEFYQTQYDAKPDLWASGLRVHALWMACSLRDPGNSDYIQSAFKLMNSKLSRVQLLAMTTQNEKLLAQYREAHKAQTSSVTSMLSNINTTNWSDNLTFMKEFSVTVNRLSNDITNDVKEFFGRLLDQCIESLGTPPCGIAVIAIGSLARCETTSYSDVEYMFVIESNSDPYLKYFHQLAYQSYYFLSLLGESNLLTYSIVELNSIGFIDRCKKALRIDGLADKAGNMPTGNGLEGSELMFTVDQLVTLYQDVVNDHHKGPKKGVSSDLVDMITHRTLVWKFGNGKLLYDNLDQRLKSIKHDNDRKTKSLNLLMEDLENYAFLSEFNNVHEGHQEVKWDFYRYPSLLLTGLNNTLDLKLETNWAMVEHLVSTRKCSEKVGIVLSFLLASALYVRIDCYHFYGEQKDKVTLLDSVEDSPQYSCPSDLFILMMSYLFPLKPLMLDSLSSISTVNINEFEQDTLTAVCLTHFYRSAEGNVLREFINKYGEELIFDKVDEFLSKLTPMQCELLLVSFEVANSLSEKHVKLVEAATTSKLYSKDYGDMLMAMCYTLTNPQKALQHALLYLETIPDEHLYAKTKAHLLVAECYETMDLAKCEESLDLARSYLDRMENTPGYTRENCFMWRLLYLSQVGCLRYEQENYEDYLSINKEYLKVAESIYGPGVAHPNLISALNGVALAYHKLNHLQESLHYYISCLDMNITLYDSDHPMIAINLQNLACVKRDMGMLEHAMAFYNKSYEMMCRLYSDIDPTHPDITMCIGQIAHCHLLMSDHREAIQWYQREYTNLNGAEAVDRRNLAVCTHNIGRSFMKLEDYKSALEKFSESLRLYKEINQYGRYDRDIREAADHIHICKDGLKSVQGPV